jgi:hypothetical protein
VTAPKAPKDGRLDPAFQERLLVQMREEQAAALRRAEIRNWVLVPVAVFSLVIGVALMFSDDLMTALLANIVATGIATVLWRTNRDWIRDRFGF